MAQPAVLLACTESHMSLELDHHELAPSSAARNVQCPGSTRAERRFPVLEEDDEDSRNGTAAHWAFQQMLPPYGQVLEPGIVAPNGVTLDIDMIEAAELLVDDVKAVCKQYGVDIQYVEVERRIPIHWWFGTTDVRLWALLPSGEYHLFNWDFKYGHRYVPEFENWQCLDYVHGSLQERTNIPWERVTVHIRIVQPRCYFRAAIREWEVPADELRAQFNIRLATAQEAIGENPRFRPGEECRDCRARYACPALMQADHAIMDHYSREQPHALPPTVIGWELKAAKRAQVMLDAYVSGLEEQSKHMIKSGENVPGVRAVQGEGRVKWTIPIKQVVAFGKSMGVDVAKEPDAITPAQAIKKGLNPAFVNSISKPGPGKVSVAVDDGTLARRIGFGKTSP
jgi:hypothetical protein